MKKTQVYRCSNCAAFVAFDSDVAFESNGGNHHTLLENARIFNVEEKEGFLGCVRCGHKHCSLNGASSSLNNVETQLPFKRTPLRVLVSIQASSDYFYNRRTYRDPEGKLNKMGDIIRYTEYTYDQKTPGVKALNYLSGLCAKLCRSSIDFDQRNVIFVGSWEDGQGEKARDTINSSSWPCANRFEWYTSFDLDALKNEVFSCTYDFVLHLQLRKGDYMVWTDSNALGKEEFLVLSWLCSGGNMLFGQWGTPLGVGGIFGDRIEMKEVVEAFRGDVEDTNMQNSLADLAEKGHFLGWWPDHARFPSGAQEKVRNALLQRKYKSWQFRKDFPHYTFTYTFRRNDATPQILDMKDAFLPEQDSASVFGIVRKKSRVLFREGFKFFQGLIEKSCRVDQRLTV